MSGVSPPAPATDRSADAGSGLRLGAALGRGLPVFAILVFVAGLGLTLAVAGETLGFDFLAYHAAASRVLDGQPAYDTSYQSAGGFGLFYYPPTFIPLILLFGLLAPDTATWAWIVLLIAAFGVGVAAMPVRRWVQWLTVLLAGLSWPFLYAVKLGQVGPLLFLLFALGWRYLDRGLALGITGGLGAAIKMQPAVVLVWALLTRRWAAVVSGVIVIAVLGSLATLQAGGGAWTDFLALVHQVSDPITTAHNFTPGAVAYQLGVDPGVASLIQWISMAVAAAAVVIAALRLGAVPSYLVAVVASQLLSPILWDHYALVLLLPVAWLVDRGWWWAALIPLSTALFLVGSIPPLVYPIAFWLTLVAVVIAGRETRPESTHVATSDG
jgi:alpha-1,2-mannosyltransferase